MTFDELVEELKRLYLFPLKKDEKCPAIKKGFKGAKKGQDIREFTKRGYNVGLSLKDSGLCVIDCDVDEKRGLNGFESLLKLESKYGPLPSTLFQHSPRGGGHLIYTSKGINNPIGKLAKDIDFKYNGYICIQPSEINGKKYEFDLEGLNDKFIISDLPVAWVNFINKSTNNSNYSNEKIHHNYKVVDIQKMFENCRFLQYCAENAQTLSEPMWHSMVTVLAQLGDSEPLIHSLSQPYPKYSFNETKKKIKAARKFGYPQSCAYISSSYPEVCQGCNSAVESEV